MTTYTNVFGGNTIRAADVSYTALALTSNQTLSWPGEGESPFTSAIIDVTPDTAGRTLSMPDARRVSPGESVTFKNVGGDSFALLDNAGGSIVTIASGAAYTVYLKANTTAAGSWGYWQAGAGSSTVDAGALDGAGLEAASSLLRVRMVVNTYAISQAFSDDDRGSLAVWTGGAGTFTMPSAVSVGDGWFMHFKNDGSGTLQIAAPDSQTFDGDADVTLAAGQGATIASDGTNFSYIAHGVDSSSSEFSYAEIAVAGTGTYTLNATEYAKSAIKFTGLLTGNRVIVVPDAERQYLVNNATTGAYTLTVKTAAGSGVAITQTKAATVYSDGTNVVAADTDYPSGISTPVAVADGGTGAITADAALTNLGGTTVGKQVFTAANAAAVRSAAGAAASGANTDITSVYLSNTGLKIRDTNASHGLSIVPGSDLAADRTLTITTGDANRTLTLSGDATVSGTTSGTNTGDQNLFSTVAVSGQSNVVADNTSDTLTLVAGSGITITTNAGTDSVTIAASASGFPAGMVAPYAGTTEPSGWLFCYGQAVSRATYADLFTAISTTYGVGDGSTTFNLPDLRGRVVAGQDDMGGVSANRLTNQSGGLNGDTLGATGGAETHTLTTAEMPAHTHSVTTYSSAGGNTGIQRYSGSSGSGQDTTSAGSGGAHNNVQPTIILNYIIKT
jgi:microcystin-dependent protein